MREEIIKTSLDGFLKKGIRKMTVQKLVSPLGISTKTVYKFFSNKEDLLKECLVLHYNKLLNQTMKTGEKYPDAVIALENIWNQAISTDFGVNSDFYHDLNYYYPGLQDEILKKQGGKIEGALNNLISQGMEEGLIRKELDPRVILQSMTILYSSLTRTGQFKKFRLSPEELVFQTVKVYLRGICTEKGLKTLKSSS